MNKRANGEKRADVMAGYPAGLAISRFSHARNKPLAKT
jgi:hypothetical protein